MRKTPIHRLLDLSIRHSIPVILTTAALSLFFAYFATKIRLSPDVESLLPEDEEVGLLMEKYGGGEASGEFLVIAVEAEDLFELDSLGLFYEMIQEIESVPLIGKSINPFNMPAFDSRGRKIGITTLSPGKRAPETEEELQLFRNRIRSSPIARNLVISTDGTVLVAIFPCRRTFDYSSLMDRVYAVTSSYEEDLAVHVSGSVAFLDQTASYLSKDLARLLGIAALIILVSYYFGFRAVRGILLPFSVVVLGTIWCLGFMSLLGFSLTIITIVIPPLVLTLGSSYSIHILNQYYREAGVYTGDRTWISEAVIHINRTILIAGATTIAGLLSLLSVSLRPIWEFAAATSFGIASCVLLSLFFFPAVLSRLKHPSPRQTRNILDGFISSRMKRLSRWVSRWKWLILLGVVLILLAFGLTFRHLVFTTDTIGYFPRKDPVVKDMLFLTGKIGGFDEISLTLIEDEKNAFLRRELLERVARLENHLRANPDICYASSFVTYLSYANAAVSQSGDTPEDTLLTAGIPESDGLIQLIARLFKTLSTEEETDRYLRTLADEDFTRITISMRIFNSRTQRFIDEAGLRDILAWVESGVRRELPAEVEWAVWGTGLRYLNLADIIKRDLITSALASLGAIFVIASAAFRSIRYGLLALIPLVTGVIANFLVMLIAGIPLDATTIMVSSVAIGVGVDDAIHFLLQYRRQRKKHGSGAGPTIENTLSITGRPILLTTASIVCGLAVLTLASFKPIGYFGILVIVALSATCAATLIVLPAVLSLAMGRSKREAKTKPENHR